MAFTNRETSQGILTKVDLPIVIETQKEAMTIRTDMIIEEGMTMIVNHTSQVRLIRRTGKEREEVAEVGIDLTNAPPTQIDSNLTIKAKGTVDLLKY